MERFEQSTWELCNLVRVIESGNSDLVWSELTDWMDQRILRRLQTCVWFLLQGIKQWKHFKIILVSDFCPLKPEIVRRTFYRISCQLNKLHLTFTLSVTSFLPRQTGSVLIDTGCIGCVWLLLSLSVQVNCKKSGDFKSWSSSVSPSNSLSLPWLSKSDKSSMSYWRAVPSSSIKMSVCTSSNASESGSLSLSWLSSSAAWSAS